VKRVEALLPFRLEFKSGEPVSDQLVYAVQKAAVAGLLKPGARFPSVRAVSQELRIHPNTAHKAVAALVAEGLLEVHPGIGTVVGAAAMTRGEAHALKDDVEHLVVKAKRMRVSADDLKKLIDRQWSHLSNDRT
jgi:DNA-binding transcriptional regulator YhcF (GntR family)